MSATGEAPFEPRHGEAVAAAPGVSRVTAPNAGPLTGAGTNSYLLGAKRLLLVDPGPNDPGHLDALVRAVAGRPVDAILLTHTHRDHCGLAPAARARFGAPILAEGPHRPSRPPLPGEERLLTASAELDLVPNRRLADNETLVFDGGTLRVVATPGHARNHLCFALEGGAAGGTLFSGDHVMNWSTTVVAPPDGSMADYMRSLDRLLARSDTRFLPGHGGAVERPQATLRAAKAHRLMREAAILSAVRAGAQTAGEVAARVYRNLAPALLGAATLASLAHLEDLWGRGLLSASGPGLAARFSPKARQAPAAPPSN